MNFFMAFTLITSRETLRTHVTTIRFLSSVSASVGSKMITSGKSSFALLAHERLVP